MGEKMTKCQGKKLVFYLLVAVMVLFQPFQGTGLAGWLQDDTVPEQYSEPETGQKDAPLSLHSPDIVAQPVLPESAGGPDLFGYTWQTSSSYSWKDASTDSGMDTDDGFVGPVPIGFNFKFYENSYNQVYISSNGLITFGKGSSDFTNRMIPFPAQPQNFIAPFWDDLVVKKDQNGKVYYQQMVDAGGKYFVAEWKNVSRRASSTDLLTFEVILRENGNICFQYQSLNGVLDSATVGIEDPDGVDGLLYLRNANGLQSLVNTQSLCFQRPAPALRMKVLPYYQGSFTLVGRAKFDVNIKNVSDVPVPNADTYELTYNSSSPGWSVLFYTADETGSLVDTNGNGLPDTGPLATGVSIPIKVKLFAPVSRMVGQFNRVTLTVASKSNPSISRSVVVHAAIPATFAQSLVDKQKGIDYRFYWDVNQRNTIATNIFTGSNLSFIGLPSGGFMYVWEKNEAKSIGGFDRPYTNLEYILIDKFGRIVKGQTKLTDNNPNTTDTIQINDRSPALAVNSNGIVGVAWVREVINTTVINSNLFYVTIDTKNPSAPVPAPINVTGNKSWRGAGSVNIPLFRSPRVAVSSDNRFFFAFTDSRQQTTGEESNIKLAIYSLAGQPVKSPYNMTSSNPGVVVYQDPALFSLEGGRVFLAYSSQDKNLITYQVYYVPVDSNGVSLKPAAAISGGQGWLPAGMQFTKGPILLSWTQTTKNQIAFAIIDSNSYAVTHGPVDLTTPDGRLGGSVSVVKNKNGDAVLSWIDVELNHQLYYALIDPAGTVVTPPITFFQVESPSSITVNDGGYALAPYDGNLLIEIPFVAK